MHRMADAYLFSRTLTNRYKCSAVAEMGERLAKIDRGRELGVFPFWGKELGPYVTQCGQGRDLPSYQVAS